MPTITRWGDVKARIMQASAGGCDESDAITIANEAIPALLNKGPWLGSVADVRIKTFQPEFSLPYEYERSLTAEQCFQGDLNMGWYAIETASTYIDPSLWGDAVLVDMGTRSTERSFFGYGKVVCFTEYPEDADVLVRIYGKLHGEQVFIQVAGPNNDFKAQDFEDLVPDGTVSTGTYDELYDIRKPVTKGQVRVAAYTQSGQLYRLITLAPNETEAQRRWYKFPECKFVVVQARSITPETNGFAFDTQYTNAPFEAGESIAIQGFCPDVFNGLWTVNAVVGSKVYVQALPASGWVMPAGEVSVFGKITKAACIESSVLKRFVKIVDDQSDVVLSNTLAMRQAVRAMWAWDAGKHAEYDKLMDEATTILKEEVTRYGQDPTHTLKRKAMYRWQYNNLPKNTAGYIVARLCLDLVGGLRVGKTDMLRLLNEAMELIIVSGKYGHTKQKRDYQVGPGGLVTLDPDAESILTAFIGGRRVNVQDIYYDSITNKGLIGMSPDGATGYQQGGFMTNGSLAGGQPRTITLAQQEPIVDEFGCCRTLYKIEPCQAMARWCVCTVVKMRYMPLKCAEDVVLIENYAALKFMVEALIARETANFGGYEAMSNKAFSILDKEIRHMKGGAQSMMHYNETFTGRYLRGRGR